jgi:hypothetical protein
MLGDRCFRSSETIFAPEPSSCAVGKRSRSAGCLLAGQWAWLGLVTKLVTVRPLSAITGPRNACGLTRPRAQDGPRRSFAGEPRMGGGCETRIRAVAVLCARTGIQTRPALDSSAAYVTDWLHALDGTDSVLSSQLPPGLSSWQCSQSASLCRGGRQANLVTHVTAVVAERDFEAA